MWPADAHVMPLRLKGDTFMKKHRQAIYCFLGVILLVVSSTSAAEQVPLNPVDGVYKVGDWTYQLISLGRGTADEKTVGKLSFKDKEVIGSEFDRLRSELGEFMWAGYNCGQSQVGWYRINPQKKYSRWTMVRIDESQQGPYWKTKKNDTR